jgi:hypothetical protein
MTMQHVKAATAAFPLDSRCEIVLIHSIDMARRLQFR